MEDPGIDPGSQPCEGCMLPCTTIPRRETWMRSSGLEPESYPWKGQILPLYYERMILRAPIVLRARNFIFGTYVQKKIEKKKAYT